MTNLKDFDKISELLQKRQSNTAWYDLRSSKELRKKSLKKYLTSTKRCAKITKPMRTANGTNEKMNLDN